MTPAAQSPFATGLRCRCPRCGEGALFGGVLTVRERCAVCGLDLRAQDAGDGPAVFVIFILGFIVVGLAATIELKYEPPMWLHLALWPALTLGGTVALLRPLKAVLIALQFQHRTREGGQL